ncbi:Oidioi.mRNA.OKI2018_I69.chr1.g2780.t1.cds [Oikopleura dioica]|uniref:Ribosome biogenesis protein NOP53 n=1 Tax=Oikopleura dioica TaxID=34765 RepID=A0ABN7SVM5_OIKDI|nr:Oidioi.mRNA.OKI2018_I69.chr1.g2780.t1.cds [Oikopleura dioica]
MKAQLHDIVMPEVEEPKTKRAKFSRKTKKGWKKIDISQEEAALEQKRFEEIHFGGDLSKTKDEDLFVIDRKPVKKKKELDRTCYHDKILANKSKVAAAVPVENRPESRKSILHNDNMLKRKAKIVDVARTDLSKKLTAEQILEKNKGLNNNYDLWSANTLTEKQKFIPAKHAKHLRGLEGVKAPKHMKFKPKMMEKVEKVSVAHAGASYNPDYDDHQALLLQEHNKEFKKVKSEDSYKEKAKPKNVATEEEMARESMRGLGILPDEDDDDQYETEEESTEPGFVKKPVRAEDRKDKKQRRKEKRVLAAQRAVRRKKQMAILLNQFYSIKKIKKGLREHEKELEKQKEFRKEKQEKRVPRIGVLKADMNPDQDVKLSEELVGTLRQLVPEGNVLTDRLKSFEARTMLEPRKKQKRHKQAFKTKWQQKRTFREWDEQFEKELKKEEKMES